MPGETKPHATMLLWMTSSAPAAMFQWVDGACSSTYYLVMRIKSENIFFAGSNPARRDSDPIEFQKIARVFNFTATQLCFSKRKENCGFRAL
jgi:hypothetical protein